MNSRDVIKLSMSTADMISLGYLEDLSDQEMLKRPCAGCNHINWQVGHLIASEHGMIEKVRLGEFPAGSKVLYAHLGGVPALNAYSFLFRNG